MRKCPAPLVTCPLLRRTSCLLAGGVKTAHSRDCSSGRHSGLAALERRSKRWREIVRRRRSLARDRPGPRSANDRADEDHCRNRPTGVVTSAATGRVLCDEWNRQLGRAPRDRKGDIAIAPDPGDRAPWRAIEFAQKEASGPDPATGSDRTTCERPLGMRGRYRSRRRCGSVPRPSTCPTMAPRVRETDSGGASGART